MSRSDLGVCRTVELRGGVSSVGGLRPIFTSVGRLRRRPSGHLEGSRGPTGGFIVTLIHRQRSSEQPVTPGNGVAGTVSGEASRPLQLAACGYC